MAAGVQRGSPRSTRYPERAVRPFWRQTGGSAVWRIGCRSRIRPKSIHSAGVRSTSIPHTLSSLSHVRPPSHFFYGIRSFLDRPSRLERVVTKHGNQLTRRRTCPIPPLSLSLMSNLSISVLTHLFYRAAGPRPSLMSISPIFSIGLLDRWGEEMLTKYIRGVIDTGNGHIGQ